jgi:methionyl-tRNA formyltransferase
VHSANHCILEGARWGGATIHFVDKGIDTGNIIARDRFPIEGLDTAHDVFVRTQESLMQLFEDLLPTLATGRLSSTPQQYYIDRGEIARTYYSTDIGSYRELTFAMNPEEVFRRARALDFPGHEPAHFLIDGKRLYVTTRTFFKEQLP